jgi:hypothetical protein
MEGARELASARGTTVPAVPDDVTADLETGNAEHSPAASSKDSLSLAGAKSSANSTMPIRDASGRRRKSKTEKKFRHVRVTGSEIRVVRDRAEGED